MKKPRNLPGGILSLVAGLAAIAASSTSAYAQSAFYLGAGALVSQLEPRVNDTGFSVTESTSTGGKIFAGVDLTTRLSMEGYFSQLGGAELTNQVVTGEIDYQAGGISGLVYLYSSRDLANRRGALLFARAGLGFLDNSSTNGINFSRVNNEHFAVGAGLEYGLENGFGLRAEILRHDADVQDFSLSVIKRFGGGEKKNTSPVAEPVTEVIESVEPDQSGIENEVEVSPEPPPLPPPPPLDSDKDGVPDRDDLCAGTKFDATVAESGCVSPLALQGVNFDSGSVALSQQANDALNIVISELKENPNLRIAVRSHTDNRGRAATNMELSRQRAVAVVRYLSDAGGIALGRLSAVGFGESQPLQSNNTAEGRRANRRVEIQVLK